MKIKTLIASLLLTASTAAVSAPVTLEADWRYNWPDHKKFFLVTFAYDDAALDSNPDTKVGLFNNSVLDFHFSYQGTNWSFDDSQPNSVSLFVRGAQPETMNTFRVYAGVKNEAGERREVQMVVESWYFSRDSLAVLPNELRMEYAQLYFREGKEKLGEGFGGFRTVPSTVPLPAGIYLMSSSLLGLVALGRRSKTRALRV